MTDYQGNSDKQKEQRQKNVEKATPAAKAEKKIEKIVVGDVIVQKKGIGRKFKELFKNADIKNAGRYVISEVVIPAGLAMFVDGVTTGVHRIAYKDTNSPYRFGGRSRTVYHSGSPIHRGVHDARSRVAPPSRAPGGRVGSRMSRDDILLSSREEAENVLETMHDIIDQYEVVSVADLNEMLGQPIGHTDNKWGWYFVTGTRIVQSREGYLLDLPPAEPIQ